MDTVRSLFSNYRQVDVLPAMETPTEDHPDKLLNSLKPHAEQFREKASTAILSFLASSLIVGEPRAGEDLHDGTISIPFWIQYPDGNYVNSSWEVINGLIAGCGDFLRIYSLAIRSKFPEIYQEATVGFADSCRGHVASELLALVISPVSVADSAV